MLGVQLPAVLGAPAAAAGHGLSFVFVLLPLAAAATGLIFAYLRARAEP